jgi:hypothetical protein
MTSGQVILYGLLAGGGLWVLHKIGQFLTKLLEAAAAIAVVFLTLWLLVKAVWKTGRWLVRHWRTTLTSTAVLAWLRWWGWPSLAITITVVGLVLVGWRWGHRGTFEPYVGRWLRGWWWRWAVYARRMPGWLRACHLTVADPGQPDRIDDDVHGDQQDDRHGNNEKQEHGGGRIVHRENDHYGSDGTGRADRRVVLAGRKSGQFVTGKRQSTDQSRDEVKGEKLFRAVNVFDGFTEPPQAQHVEKDVLPLIGVQEGMCNEPPNLAMKDAIDLQIEETGKWPLNGSGTVASGYLDYKTGDIDEDEPTANAARAGQAGERPAALAPIIIAVVNPHGPPPACRTPTNTLVSYRRESMEVPSARGILAG